MNLKLQNGQYKDFASLFMAYDLLPANKQNLDVRENIRTAMIAAGLQNMTNKQERAIMYNPDGDWYSVIQYVEKIEGDL